MNYKDIAQRIINLSGGKDNFYSVANCMTRVRIKYKDESKVKKQDIKEIDGVLGVSEAETFQIIVGQGKSVKVKEEMNKILGLSEHDDSKEVSSDKKKNNFLKTLANICVPTLTAIIASGVIQGINNILVNTTSVQAVNKGIEATDTLSALFPILISTGLHHGLTPINMELINSSGATAIFPIQIMSNAGLVGAGLALYFLTKNKQTKEIAKGVLPTTFLAVGEPTMYGLVIPSGFGFITAFIITYVVGKARKYE